MRIHGLYVCARTEEFLRGVTRLNDLHNTRTDSFDAWDVVGEDTHVTSGSGKVDLNYVRRAEDRLATTQVR